MPRGRPPKKPKLYQQPIVPLPGTIPECPKSLSRAGKLKWKKLVAELEPLGILTQADGDVMMLYCVASETFDKAERKLTKEGLVLKGKGPKGGVYQNPYMAIRNRADQNMQKLGKLLGLNSASPLRPKPNFGPKLADDPKAKFFQKREGTG